MPGWIEVPPDGLEGLSAAPGKVKLDNVPPGSYRLRSWHPELPPGAPALDQALTVAAAGTAATVRLPVAGGTLQ